MSIVLKNKLLEYKPDTVQKVRKLYGLEEPGRAEEAVKILREWIEMQPHYKKKDFSYHYLETLIIICKGSIERAKSQFDKMCTLRTLLPQFFGDFNIKKDFPKLYDPSYSVVLPKMTDDCYRVYLVRCEGEPAYATMMADFFKSNIIYAEYLRNHDYVSGFILILDYLDASLMDYISAVNVAELKQVMSIYMEGYGMKIKAIYIISTSKFIDTLIKLLKQVLSPKVASRIQILKSRECLQEVLPKSILPKDYGGEERSLKELQSEWVDILSTEEHLNYLKDMNNAVTDESRRQRDKFTDVHSGLPGTFRLLSID